MKKQNTRNNRTHNSNTTNAGYGRRFAANNAVNYTLHGQLASDAEQRIAKINRAMPIAIVGTVLGALALPMLILFANASGFFAKLILAMMPLSMILGIVSYILGSGFGDACAFVGKVAKWGWFLIPIFPADVIVGFVMLFVGIDMLFFFPAFVLMSARRKAYKDLRQATQFAQGWEQAAA